MFEWIMASIWSTLGWDRFMRLSPENQAIIIAGYREKSRLDAVLEYQEQKRANSGAKVKKKGGG